MAKRTLDEAGEGLLHCKRAMTTLAPHQSITTNVSIHTPQNMAPFLAPGPASFYPWPPFMFPCRPWTWPPFTAYYPIAGPQMHMPRTFAEEVQAFQLPSVAAWTHTSPNTSNLFMSLDNANVFDHFPLPGGARYVDKSPDFSSSVTPPDVNIWEMDKIALDSSATFHVNSSEVMDADFSGESFAMPTSDTPTAFEAIFSTDHDQTSTSDALSATGSSSYLFDTSSPKSHDLDMQDPFYRCFNDVGDSMSVVPSLEQANCSTAPAPSPSPFLHAQSPPTPCPQHNGSTVQWYRRFYLHNDYHVNATTIAIISRRVPAVLASLADATDSTPAIYAKYIAFMTTLKPTDVVNTVLSLIMHLFFYIADGPDACLWATKARSTMSARANATHPRKSGGAGHESDLFDAVHMYLPPHVRLETCATFIATLKSWRRIGSCYAFLARRLGLGALLCARDLLHPGSMWGCAQGKDRYGASEEALRYLEGVVKVPDVANKCGAEDLMHGLLRDVLSKFAEFDGGGDEEGEAAGEKSDLQAGRRGKERKRRFPGF
ncbi:hypothetical protein ACN47E_001284 [Coniothyrium glycines]